MTARTPWWSASLHAATGISAGLDGSALQAVPPLPWQLGTFPVALPPPSAVPTVTLETAIHERVSSRDFSARAHLPLAVLGDLLVRSCGLTKPAAIGAGITSHRATPAAGGQYAVHAFPVVSRVKSLAPGVYRYQVKTHTLNLLRSGDYLTLLALAALDQPYLMNASVIVVLVGMPGPLEQRYGNRAYRYLLFEAGHVAQNLLLNGSARQLRCLAVGGFVDQTVNHLLGLDGYSAMALSLVAMAPAPEQEPPV